MIRLKRGGSPASFHKACSPSILERQRAVIWLSQSLLLSVRVSTLTGGRSFEDSFSEHSEGTERVSERHALDVPPCRLAELQ